jgi:hypothetical protein
MRINGFLPAGAILLALLAGCSTARRFRSASYQGVDHTLVEADLFGTRLQSGQQTPTGRYLWDLSASAQTRLIQILDERYPDNSAFIRSLGNPYRDEATPGQSMTGQDLRMVFTIRKTGDQSMLDQKGSHYSPADRIVRLRLLLEIPEEYHLQFTDWNRFATEYGEIEIADIGFAQNLDLELESELGQATADLKGGVGRTEKQQVRTRYLKLNGQMSPGRILMEAEGTREVDLAGNITAEVSLEFRGYPEKIVRPVFSPVEADGSYVPVLEYLQFEEVLVPAMTDAPDTLFASLSLEYIYRHVRSGWDTYPEWDDVVEFYTGIQTKEVPLLMRKDYVPPFYSIGIDDEDHGRKLLRYSNGSGKEYLLQFLGYEDASHFYHWLMAGTNDLSSIGNVQLFLEGRPLTADSFDVHHLRIIPVY